MRRLLTAALLALAACGGDDGQDAATTTTTEAQKASDLTVRVVAQKVGIGCGSTAPVGNGSQLVVTDAGGERIGVGTFVLSDGAELCDWTATVDDVPHGLVVLMGDTDELATVEHDGDPVVVEATVGGVSVAN